MDSFMRFPPELLTNISRQLCPPLKGIIGDGTWADAPPEWFDVMSRMGDLSRLSRTCKTLRDIAQPLLFQYGAPVNRKHVAFVHVLCRRPDLALLIKELRVVNWYPMTVDEPVGSPEDIRMMNAVLVKHFQTENQAAPQFNLIDGKLDQDYEVGDVFFAIAVAQASNVRTITVDSRNWYMPPLCAGSLPYLTEVAMRYDDTELGFGLDILEDIMAAAPALKTIRVGKVAGASEMFHRNLRTLELYFSVLDSEELQNLLPGLSMLEKFVYESGDAMISDRVGELHPREMAEALRCRRKTLKHLSLQFKESMQFWYDMEQQMIDDLSYMRVLETLELECDAILHPVDTSAPDVMILVRLLPQSICSLAIEGPRAVMTESLLQLAKMAPEHFPFLKEVRVWDLSDQMWAAVEVAFTTVGIECLRVDIFGPSNCGGCID